MSKSIKSYPEEKRVSVVARRLASNAKGCGYWAAVDYQNKKTKVTK